MRGKKEDGAENSKLEAVRNAICEYDSLAVAFSGGVDSSLLLALAKRLVPEKRKLAALTAVSPVHPHQEIEAAVLFARRLDIQYVLVETTEMDSAGFIANGIDRCYLCRQIVFSALAAAAERLGIAHLVYGANADDKKDYRPGMKAAAELGVRAPLMEAGLSKKDIRSLSKAMGLSTWDQPASGCLATRIPYGSPVTAEKLSRVEKAETALKDLGFPLCRVRHYGELAKIEVPIEALHRLLTPSVRAVVSEKLRAAGFLYVSVDMEGYGPGRLNRSL